ncbi:hypothetical protein BCR43DRAFT_493664, partial [Syncephalastrum racemosum]
MLFLHCVFSDVRGPSRIYVSEPEVSPTVDCKSVSVALCERHYATFLKRPSVVTCRLAAVAGAGWYHLKQ